MTGPRTRRGAGDPTRPTRLVEAALSILLTDGIQALSHRAVAAKAGVPLGSTTYYFQDLDALLKAAIEHLTEQTRGTFDALSASITAADQLPDKLSDMLFKRLTVERDLATLAYELYGLAMRRPALREVSTAWKQVLTEAIGRHTDETTVPALVAMIDGLMLQGLIAPNPPSRHYILAALKAVHSAPLIKDNSI